MSTQIFVMSFMTNLDYESEIDDPSIAEMPLRSAAEPRVAAISTTGSDLWIDACRKIVEEALASEDADLYGEGEEISEYTWEDGNWKELKDGFPHVICTVKQDGQDAAVMVIQRRTTFD